MPPKTKFSGLIRNWGLTPDSLCSQALAFVHGFLQEAFFFLILRGRGLLPSFIVLPFTAHFFVCFTGCRSLSLRDPIAKWGPRQKPNELGSKIKNSIE